MNKRSSDRRAPFSAMVPLGSLLVILGFATYPIVAALNPTEAVGSEGFVMSYAYLALGLDIFGLCLLFCGSTNILANLSMGKASGTLSSISTVFAVAFARRRYSRLLLASSFVYGIFFAFASGIIVFQPAFSFSEAYRVGIPSLALVTCCGPVGQTPQVVAYITQHLGLVLIPANLLLLFSISWLVGLNASFASFALSLRTKNARTGWFGGIGAFIGLFASCPTCAGLAAVSLLSGPGTFSASFFLGPLQIVFVVVSLPILVAAPLIAARSLLNLDARACNLS